MGPRSKSRGDPCSKATEVARGLKLPCESFADLYERYRESRHIRQNKQSKETARNSKETAAFETTPTQKANRDLQLLFIYTRLDIRSNHAGESLLLRSG